MNESEIPPLPPTMLVGKQHRVHVLAAARWYEAHGMRGPEVDKILSDLFGDRLTISLANWCRAHGISEATRFRVLAKRRAAHQAA